MEMMFVGVVLIRTMALQTDSVFRHTQLQAVGFVAVAACHSGPVHLALQERAVLIDFAIDLTIGVVQRLL
ncbi:MAG: hypothetical protein ACXWE4_08575 [Methylobacter sp.]